MAKGYWIPHIDVSDPEGYKAYMAATPEAHRKYDGHVLVRGGTCEVVEGKGRSRNVLREFPDYATALACYRSPEYQRAKQATGGKPEEYRIPDADVRKNLRDQYLPLVKDGKQMLSKALELDPQYDQAMAYLNLLLRIEAAMWDDPALAEALIVKADMWVTKAIDTKRKRAPEATESARLDLDGPPPGPAGRATMAKAPPPPPPPPSRERSHQIASALPPPKRGPHEIPFPGQYNLGAGLQLVFKKMAVKPDGGDKDRIDHHFAG